ncbi:hypothetical protein ACLKA7_016117 [Drosophila subpalustris]
MGDGRYDLLPLVQSNGSAEQQSSGSTEFLHISSTSMGMRRVIEAQHNRLSEKLEHSSIMNGWINHDEISSRVWAAVGVTQWSQPEEENDDMRLRHTIVCAR